MTHSRVFVVNVPSRDGRASVDVTPAASYGELKYVYPGGRPVIEPTEVVERAYAGLVDFTENDYLLPIGHPVLVAAATAVASQAVDGKLNVLIWMEKAKCYSPVRLSLWQPTRKLEKSA